MSVGHTNSHLGIVIQQAHTVDTLWHLHDLEQVQTELVVDEDSPVSTPNEQLVIGNC
jgi:hypothetical protein